MGKEEPLVRCVDLPTRKLRILPLHRGTPVLSRFSRRVPRRARAAVLKRCSTCGASNGSDAEPGGFLPDYRHQERLPPVCVRQRRAFFGGKPAEKSASRQDRGNPKTYWSASRPKALFAPRRRFTIHCSLFTIRYPLSLKHRPD